MEGINSVLAELLPSISEKLADVLRATEEMAAGVDGEQQVNGRLVGLVRGMETSIEGHVDGLRSELQRSGVLPLGA